MYFLLLDVHVLHRNWFSRNMFGIFFFAHWWVGKMPICIEIIFSELFLQVCQIYKYHYCNGIFLVWIYPLQFISSFIYYVWVNTRCTYFLGILFLSNLFTQIVFLEIKVIYCISFYLSLHHNFKMKSPYSDVVKGTFCWRESLWQSYTSQLFSHSPLGPQFIFEDAGL